MTPLMSDYSGADRKSPSLALTTIPTYVDGIEGSVSIAGQP
uniref:Uncharacterized protein n=1 Tax=Pseudomonas fluorescens (strain SBW25) TaxID=216595 RepID=A0A0G4E542_PSEFS|nr:hypothetical protein PQBR57_0392 [Pseudomonas fluorescens SBW25]